ncbi:hypothetical protein Glove_212g9 [Diversispora epigaea]|uniref:SAM domain-containing protein n=1 Tax=Diversispora epigaea TaxID=1348612 RepID=A0A397IL20_9GLOM|nr:hypothetical protein Glove_212g9 [Diversispora epigaea]
MFCQIINSFLKSSRVNVNNSSLSIRNSCHLPNLIIRKGFKSKIIISSKTKNSKRGKKFDEKFDYNKDYNKIYNQVYSNNNNNNNNKDYNKDYNQKFGGSYNKKSGSFPQKDNFYNTNTRKNISDRNTDNLYNISKNHPSKTFNNFNKERNVNDYYTLPKNTRNNKKSEIFNYSDKDFVGKNEKKNYIKSTEFNIFDDKINDEKNHYDSRNKDSRNKHSNESKNSFSKNNDVKNVSYNHDKRGSLMRHQNQEDNFYHTRELRPTHSSRLDNRETYSIDISSSENVSTQKKSTHSSSRLDNQEKYSNNNLSNENVSTRNKLTRTREPISTLSFSHLDDQEIYSGNDDKYSSSSESVSVYNEKTPHPNRLTRTPTPTQYFSRLDDQETYSNNTSNDDEYLLPRENISIQDDKIRYKNKSTHENSLRENKSKTKEIGVESENANESDDKISTEEIIGLPLQKLTRKQRQRIHNKPKDKEKIYNNYIQVNFKLLEDFPKWLRGLKLQKFIPIFSGMHWTKIINLTWEELEAMGVYQYQVKKRLLVSFENIKKAMKERQEN